jgi:transcriptional regulator with XRE-family HTH domain
VDRTGLAEFLRRRRDSLQPEDVGLQRGPGQRRTTGLRREEVAAICHLSTDYYSRLEQQRGPRPSTELLQSIAQGLSLSLDERDHLFHLAGHRPPARGPNRSQVSPDLLRVLDRLAGTPAEIVTELGETLRQNASSLALTGDTTGGQGPARSRYYRWFMEPAARQRYASATHPELSRTYASRLRQIATLRGTASQAARMVDLLLTGSAEFRALWHDHTISAGRHAGERVIHPRFGVLDLVCSTLSDPDYGQSLLVHTAAPGSESDLALQLLAAPAAHAVR